jgi:hypothetical protein
MGAHIPITSVKPLPPKLIERKVMFHRIILLVTIPSAPRYGKPFK